MPSGSCPTNQVMMDSITGTGPQTLPFLLLAASMRNLCCFHPWLAVIVKFIVSGCGQQPLIA